MRIISFYMFLILNWFNFQYVPGLRKINSLLTRLRMFFLRHAGAAIGASSIVRPDCLVIAPKRLKVGQNTIIGPRAKIMNFSDVVIGNDVEIGPNVTLQTNEHLILDPSKPLGKQGGIFLPISVGDGCYFGADVTILHGVRITNNCLIGAKSLVNKSIDVSGLYAGCPARLIKKFDVDEFN